MGKTIQEKISTKGKSYLKAQRFLLNYASGFSYLFKNGTVRFSIEQGKISLRFYLGTQIQIESIVDFKTSAKEEIDEMIYTIQDFVINCYFNFERNGGPMKLKDLGTLLGVDHTTADYYLKAIEKKMNKLNQNLKLIDRNE